MSLRPDPVRRPLCPEFRQRAAMSDDEFWQYVYGRPNPQSDPEYDPDEEDEAWLPSPCPTCGEYGACEYDSEGRALIHARLADDDD